MADVTDHSDDDVGAGYSGGQHGVEMVMGWGLEGRLWMVLV